MSDHASDTATLEIVVTYLEMHKPPTRPTVPAPPVGKIALLRAERPTISYYRYLYNTVGEPWLWWERRLLPDPELERIIHDPLVEIYVLYVDGVPAGYAELDRRNQENVELAYFGLVPQFIGRKLGPFLLNWAVDTAWFHQPKRLWVNTNNLDHPKALQIYQKAGFVPYRQETKEIPNPRLTVIRPIANGRSNATE
ncbi:MAG TPA: GNAT family N-acetyltransferase [Alphaproteobacteria bacterium]|nr:GNAT family N-acetyltransferase [Alphaproteobacteria bacterium]